MDERARTDLRVPRRRDPRGTQPFRLGQDPASHDYSWTLISSRSVPRDHHPRGASSAYMPLMM